MLPASMARMLARPTWSSLCAQTAVKKSPPVQQGPRDHRVLALKGQDMIVVEPEAG